MPIDRSNSRSSQACSTTPNLRPHNVERSSSTVYACNPRTSLPTDINPIPMSKPPKRQKPSKYHLPTKICERCRRPFTWRKKWERDWERVKYCSDACRKQPPSVT
ncbi:DUF2256 domain-containing protein [Pirellulaceae bacterium SH467]